jgi:hypothetical protein
MLDTHLASSSRILIHAILVCPEAANGAPGWIVVRITTGGRATAVVAIALASASGAGFKKKKLSASS